DQVIGAEGQRLTAIGGGGLGAGGGAGEGGDAFDASQLHRIIDGGGADVQSAPEDEGEAEDVIDLIGKIAAAGGDQRARRDRADIVGQDFRVGVGKGKDDWVFGHFGHHRRGQNAGAGKAKEEIGAADYIVQGRRRGALGEVFLLRGHL